MLDRYKRNITYLRISLTRSCNLRCFYCMPPEGIPPDERLLSFEQIISVISAGVKLGIVKIRLTGGEPLLREGITDLVRMIKTVQGVEHLGMTTNGVMLARYAGQLKSAGLDSVNISLDTLDPVRYRRITRIGNIRPVLDSIEAVKKEGVPAKINMVVMEDTGDGEIERMQEFCRQRGLRLQLINHYSLSEEKTNDYRFERPPDCERCNRIRLLADGTLKSCLHSNLEIPLDFADIEGSLQKAIELKPQKGHICTNRNLAEVGG